MFVSGKYIFYSEKYVFFVVTGYLYIHRITLNAVSSNGQRNNQDLLWKMLSNDDDDDDSDVDTDDDNDDNYDDNDDDADDNGNLERTSAQGGQWTSSPKTIIW